MIALAAVVAFIKRIARTFSSTAWLVIAILAAFLIFGAYCSHRAAEGERDRHVAATAKVERKASGARETAAGEALTDTTTIRNRQEERDHAAEALPDGVPDDRELRRRCRQLRDAGRSLAACRGPEGPA
jgi:hypothetical protein